MERYIKTDDGLTLWTEAFGEAGDPAIVLIMGAMNQGVFWPDDFCRELARLHFYVIRYDNRDTGKSDNVDFKEHPYDLNDLAKDAVAVMKGHGAQSAIFIGLSMGGYIAQIAAAANPRIVSKLVLISTTADHRPYMAATMGRADTNFGLPCPEKKLLDYIRSLDGKPLTATEIEQSMVRGWKTMYSENRAFPEEELVKTLRLAAQRAPDQSRSFNHGLAVDASPDRLELVKTITAPTLVIHGKYDLCLPLPHGEYLAKHIPGAQLRVLEMGHAFQWSWSHEVLTGIARFIKEA